MRPFTATNVPGLTSTAAAQPPEPAPAPDPYADEPEHPGDEAFAAGYAAGTAAAATYVATQDCAWLHEVASILIAQGDAAAGRVWQLAMAFERNLTPAEAADAFARLPAHLAGPATLDSALDSAIDAILNRPPTE